MDRVDDLDVVEFRHDVADRGEDVFHILAEVLAAVARHADHALPVEIELRKLFERRGIVVVLVRMGGRLFKRERQVRGGEERVDDGIAREDDPVVRNVLSEEIIAVPFGRREVDVGDVAGQRPVHLLGPRGVLVVRPETRFDVADGDLVVERRKRRDERRRRIAVDEDEVGLLFFKDRIKAEQNAGGDRRERLAGLHQVQVVIGPEVEQAQDLVEHLAVLGRHAEDRVDARFAFEPFHERRHFDRFGARSEDRKDFHSSSSFWTVPFSVGFVSSMKT